MNSSTSYPKPNDKISFKPVSPFDLFYQLTYMSAMAAAGITRSKTFEVAAQSSSEAAAYFTAINMLVDELRYDYPEACRRVGARAKSENMKSFLLRLSDALRSGEPLADFLAREAEVQGEHYQNSYERDLEALKQWSNAFSSIVISVALIVIIQVISSMLYSMNQTTILGLVSAGLLMSGFGTWIIWRSAPHEIMNVMASEGSHDQRLSLRLLRTTIPLGIMTASLLYIVGLDTGWILIAFALFLVPVGAISLISDRHVTKKDVEFSTFLRSTGGMASSTGTTLKEALTKIDLTSFPALEPDINRLSTRLQALVEPEICWRKFAQETGSRLISDVISIFYRGIRIGGDPERVGFLCSLFVAKTTQLRAKRRLTSGTFSGLAAVMQVVVSGLMVFVLSIVQNFAELVKTLMPTGEGTQTDMSIGMADFSAGELQFLAMITLMMIIVLATVSALASIATDGGYKLKVALFLAVTTFVSGVCYLVVPPLVDSILKA